MIVALWDAQFSRDRHAAEGSLRTRTTVVHEAIGVACADSQIVKTQSAVIIGTPFTCQQVQQQLHLSAAAPQVIGWILTDARDAETCNQANVLGTVERLAAIVGKTSPDLALVSLPAAMQQRIVGIRTQLRRLGIAERFLATLQDQLAGVGPRTHLDIDLSALINRPARHFDEQSVQSVLAGRRVLITGAGGSIGSELSRIVATCQPSELIIVDRAENSLFEIDRQIAARHPGLPRRTCLHDVVDTEDTRRLLAEIEPHVIFHAAAHKHVPMMEDHPLAALRNNLYGTKSVADAADMVGVERFVMISTDKAVRPVSVMGATKRLAELYVQHMNRNSPTEYSIVRFGNVLGSAGSVLDTWSSQIAEGGPVTVTHPDMTRYFMTIEEAASLVIQSAALVDKADGSEVFLLDMGDPVRIVDLAERFVAMHGLQPVQGEDAAPVDEGSIRIVLTGVRPGEKMHEELASEGAPIRPSVHPEIFVWELAAPNPVFVRHMLNRLSSANWQDRPPALAQLIRTLSRGCEQPATV